MRDDRARGARGGRPGRARGRATRSCSTAGSRPGVVGLDESQLTGESDVVRKRPGDELFSGSFATTGSGRYVAEKVQGASLANQITAGARDVPAGAHAAPERGQPRDPGRARDRDLPRDPAGDPRACSRRSRWATSSRTRRCSPGWSRTACSCRSRSRTRWARCGSSGSGRWSSSRTRSRSLSHVDVLCLDKTGTLTANRLAGGAVRRLGGATEDEVIAALSALAASATARNQTSRGDRRRAGRRDARPLAARGAVLVGPEVERGGVRRRRRPAPGIVALGAPTVPAPVPRDRRATARPMAGPSVRDADRRLGRAGLRVLLVATYPDAGRARRSGEDDAAATLPAGMRPLGLVGLERRAAPRGGGDAARVPRGRASPSRSSRATTRRPSSALARQAGLGRRPASISRPGPGRSSTTRRSSRRARDTVDLRPDHAGAEGAARRRAARRAATTSR